jgi:hypothetical protein
MYLGLGRLIDAHAAQLQLLTMHCVHVRLTARRALAETRVFRLLASVDHIVLHG